MAMLIMICTVFFVKGTALIILITSCRYAPQLQLEISMTLFGIYKTISNLGSQSLAETCFSKVFIKSCLESIYNVRGN